MTCPILRRATYLTRESFNPLRPLAERAELAREAWSLLTQLATA